MLARITMSRLPAKSMQVRLLSTQGEQALRKLQEVMQEYRLANYTQETPMRFKKEVIAAAKDSQNQVDVIRMQRVLNNIGASQKLTPEELRLIFAEVGVRGSIPADRMVQLL